MTSSLTSVLPFGDLVQSLRKLQEDGVSPAEFAAIGKDPAVCATVVEVLKRKVVVSVKKTVATIAVKANTLFATPEEQIERILAINEAVWKDSAITAEAIRALGDPPECLESDKNGLYCVALVYDTGSVPKTFKRNWEACVHIHTPQGVWQWNEFLFTPQGVRQRTNALPRPTGLRWVVAELGRQHKGKRVCEARTMLDEVKCMGMGAELPLIAALHPEWAKAMNGDDIPFVDAPDLEVAPGGQGEFDHAPFLYFYRDGRQVYLYAHEVGYPDSRYGSGSLQ